MLGRSTKAGASTPATPARSRLDPPIERHTTAQRRPGHQPRRHVDAMPGVGRGCPRCSLNEGRGINPGDTSVPVRPLAALLFTRSTKAGASTPATLVDRFPRTWCRPNTTPLNEGRGINPGDTRTSRFVEDVVDDQPALNEGRGINPGDTRRSIMEILRPPLRDRSTKAGASTPATLERIHLRSCRTTYYAGAQRRPGHQPRRHPCRGTPLGRG